MSIIRGSWESLGYARIGRLADPTTSGCREALEKLKIYDFQEDGTYLWCGLSNRGKAARILDIIGEIRSDNYEDDRPYATINHLWWPTEKNIPIEMIQDDIPKSMAPISRKRGFRAFEAIGKLLFYCRWDQYKEALKNVVAPQFFSRYPGGRILLIRTNDLVGSWKAVVKIIALVSIYGLEELKRMKGTGNMRALSGAHREGIDTIGESVLSTVLSSFYPRIHGFICPRFSFKAVFIPDKPLKIRQRYPWDVYDFLRPGRMFSESSSLGISDLLEHRRAESEVTHHRYYHRRRWKVEEVVSLLTWCVDGINRVYQSLFDLGNFRTEDNALDSTKHWQLHLTIDRIVLESLHIATERDSLNRKTLFWNLLDKFATISAKKPDLKSRSKLFERLLRKSHYDTSLRRYLTSLPEPFRSYTEDLGEKLYSDVIETTMKGIWASSRVDQSGVQTKEWDSNSRAFREMSNKISPEDYTVKTVHAVRNSLHTYSLMNKAFEQYLSINNCELGEWLADLNLIWLLMFLSDPNALLSGQWRETTV